MLRYSPGAALMALAAAIGLIVALADYFMPSSGVGYTLGAGLVCWSNAALLVATLLLFNDRIRHNWFGVVLTVLIILGIAGTALAGYMLDSVWLPIVMAVCFIGWLVHLFWHPGTSRLQTATQ